MDDSYTGDKEKVGGARGQAYLPPLHVATLSVSVLTAVVLLLWLLFSARAESLAQRHAIDTAVGIAVKGQNDLATRVNGLHVLLLSMTTDLSALETLKAEELKVTQEMTARWAVVNSAELLPTLTRLRDGLENVHTLINKNFEDLKKSMGLAPPPEGNSREGNLEGN